MRFFHWAASAWMLAVALPSPAAEIPEPLPAVDDRWLRITSPNFELFSHNSEQASRELLYHFELVRAVFLERFPSIERARRDVTIYYFRAHRDFQEYSDHAGRKRTTMAGFYHADPDRAVISLAPGETADDAKHVVYHEYIHHLLHAAEINATPWFSEGAAELYAGLRVANGEVQVGHPVLGRLFHVRKEKLLSLDALFGMQRGSLLYNSRDHTGLFYSQSWALLHYLICGESELPAEGIERFLRVAGDVKAAGKIDLPAFFQECFGMDYAAMLKRLERYVHSGKYSFSRRPLPDIPDKETYIAIPLARDHVRVRLAELAVRINRSAAGKLVLLRATVSTPKDARPFEALGANAWMEGDRDAAIEHWADAVEAGTSNVAIFRELALTECQEWFREFDYDLRIPSDIAGRLRERLHLSIRYEPQQSAAYESLAWVEAFAEDRKIANVNLVQEQFRRLGDPARTAVALAMVRVRLGKPADALNMLKSVRSLNPDQWTAQAAEDMMARLEDRPIQRITVSERAVEDEAAAAYAPRVAAEIRLVSVPLPEDL